MKPVLLWFRRNLRVADNAALTAAAESGCPVIPVYIRTEGDRGGASSWWLHHSLVSLDHELRGLGSKLVICSGEPADVLQDLLAAEEALVDSRLDDQIDIEAFDDSLLHHPNSVHTQSNTPYRVFTPFWKAASALGEPSAPLPVPSSIEAAARSPESLSIEDLGLLPKTPDWAQGLRDTWAPGEPGGLHRLDELGSVVQYYGEHRDRPDLDATSRLSPHLHFGEVSVRQVWQAVRGIEARQRASKGAEALLRQLYWRDFSTYLLFHFPDLPDQPLRDEFRDFPWMDDAAGLRAWQQGMTGYPIVDAGMRQLWSSGWMHNRVRMIAASFLVKDLLVPWQQGADWFLDTLVDADLANNSASWQWVAGCGTDAAPYFRIFNPVLQGKKFDPEGAYVRRWIPELAELPNDVIHEPWKASEPLLADAGIELGNHYPRPIVDHGAARDHALAAYQAIRGNRTSKDAPGSS